MIHQTGTESQPCCRKELFPGAVLSFAYFVPKASVPIHEWELICEELTHRDPRPLLFHRASRRPELRLYHENKRRRRNEAGYEGSLSEHRTMTSTTVSSVVDGLYYQVPQAYGLRRFGSCGPERTLLFYGEPIQARCLIRLWTAKDDFDQTVPVSKILNTWQHCQHGAGLEIPTSTGKTEIILKAVSEAGSWLPNVEPGRKTLFVLPKQSLLATQLAQRIVTRFAFPNEIPPPSGQAPSSPAYQRWIQRRIKKYIGRIRGNRCDLGEGHDFVIAIIHTLGRRAQSGALKASDFHRFGCLMLDESDRSLADSFLPIFKLVGRIRYKVYCSATITNARPDGRQKLLGWHFGEIVHKGDPWTKTSQRTRCQFLEHRYAKRYGFTQRDAQGHRIKDTLAIKRALDFDDEFTYLNILLLAQLVQQRRRVLYFVSRQLLPADGVYEILQQVLPPSATVRRIRASKNKALEYRQRQWLDEPQDVVVSTPGVFDIGADCQHFDTVILPLDGQRRYVLQEVGRMRALRRNDPRNPLLVLAWHLPELASIAAAQATTMRYRHTPILQPTIVLEQRPNTPILPFQLMYDTDGEPVRLALDKEMSNLQLWRDNISFEDVFHVTHQCMLRKRKQRDIDRQAACLKQTRNT